MSNFQITELHRRLANLVRIGTITEVDHEQALVRVQIGELVTGWLPWMTGRAGQDSTWWPPEPGEQVIVLSPSGDLAQGVVLMGLYQDSHPAPGDTAGKHTVSYHDGAIIEYDRDAHHLKAVLPEGGTADLVADGGITIHGDIAVTGTLSVSADVEISGDLNVSGDTSVTGDIATDGDVSTATVTLNTHYHAGGGGGPVLNPTPGSASP